MVTFLCQFYGVVIGLLVTGGILRNPDLDPSCRSRLQKVPEDGLTLKHTITYMKIRNISHFFYLIVYMDYTETF